MAVAPRTLVFIAAGLVLVYVVARAGEADKKEKAATLAELCTVSPDDYWRVRTGLLESYPFGAAANSLVAVASATLTKVLERDDLDLTMLQLISGGPAPRLESIPPNARYYVFEKICQGSKGSSITWRLSLLATARGEFTAISLIPVVPAEFYLRVSNFPNLDFMRNRKDAEAVLKRAIPVGTARSEAVEIMKLIGEKGRYGELHGPLELSTPDRLRYDYILKRDVGVLPRIALEEIQTVVILMLDDANRVVDVRIH